MKIGQKFVADKLSEVHERPSIVAPLLKNNNVPQSQYLQNIL